MNFESFWADLIATLGGGIALAFLFFLLEKKSFQCQT